MGPILPSVLYLYSQIILQLLIILGGYADKQTNTGLGPKSPVIFKSWFNLKHRCLLAFTVLLSIGS